LQTVFLDEVRVKEETPDVSEQFENFATNQSSTLDENSSDTDQRDFNNGYADSSMILTAAPGGGSLGIGLLAAQMLKRVATRASSSKITFSHSPYYMRFEVLTFVKMSVSVFWVATPCGLVGRWRQYVHLKLWYLRTSPHSITTQKTNINSLCCFLGQRILCYDIIFLLAGVDRTCVMCHTLQKQMHATFWLENLEEMGW
jgi:hypothetical protein